MCEGLNQFKDSQVYIKKYRIRSTGQDGKSIETTIPKEVFEREARKVGLSIEEALKNLIAVWRFDSFSGLYLTFEIKENSP